MSPAEFRRSAKPLSGRYLSLTKREEIALLLVQGHSVCEIARRLGRAASTVSREIRRNAATRIGNFEYRATTAQWHAERAARRPKVAKLAAHDTLRCWVEDRLSGAVAKPGDKPVTGPTVSWKGRRHGPRRNRRWSKAWSPEQIARRLPIDFPDDHSIRISHEAIYQALFVQGRGALRRDLTARLRSGRALRVPRARVGQRGKGFVSPEIMISERPAEADEGAVPGHWEGDLILGIGSSAIGALVERTARFTMLLHLLRMEGYGAAPGDQERTSAGRTRCRGGAGCHLPHHHHLPPRAATIAHLGSGRGDGSACSLETRRRRAGLLLRPAKPVATRLQREYQRAIAPVLSQRHRPQHA